MPRTLKKEERRQRAGVGERVSHCERCGWPWLPSWVIFCDVDLLQRTLSSFFSIAVAWTTHFTETSSTPLLTKCMILWCESLLSANLACFLLPCKLQELHLRYEYQGNLENARTRFYAGCIKTWQGKGIRGVKFLEMNLCKETQAKSILGIQWSSCPYDALWTFVDSLICWPSKR